MKDSATPPSITISLLHSGLAQLLISCPAQVNIARLAGIINQLQFEPVVVVPTLLSTPAGHPGNIPDGVSFLEIDSA